MTRVNNLFYLDISDFELVFNQLLDEEQEYSTDIPAFKNRYEGKLESILAQIKAVYFGVEVYDTIEKKAAWLFYSIIKNHPLANGNKRLALVIYFTFLLENVHRLYLDEISLETELFEMTVLVAESTEEHRQEILDMLETKTLQYIGPFSDS
ncbi:type II toxin-antitoxin system death-on-curing family toxin [Apibacter raozihei]|uniref:type II toxin-antitoxin system death-on-curing family toxin n=1 Tax=Apibacter raozihei TaxID=2500547 RepID=UPI000FE41821|nr:type II toxin-antitoxin system death-on-curing family toxin [Apibacter raozihei]